MAKNDHYSLKPILRENAQWNVIYGGRNNGKTYAVHEYAIERYYKTGEQMALIRRWNDDFVGARSVTMFANQVINGNGKNNVARITGGEWDGITNSGKRWFLTRGSGDNKVVDEKPFCIGFSITAMEHDKSTAYPQITTILFDEFISKTVYLQDEFSLLTNVLQTIIRDRTNVRIFMLGNTINKYCPYFNEMGLTRAKTMPEGTIDVYTYGASDMRVAVERTASRVSKSADAYFAFDNPKLEMVRGASAWEIDIYPHCPCRFAPKDIAFIFFIRFDGELMQCEIVTLPDATFLYIHDKTTPLQNPKTDLIYDLDAADISPNVRRNIFSCVDTIDSKIKRYFVMGKVFYQDNTVGDRIKNYMLRCGVKMK